MSDGLLYALIGIFSGGGFAALVAAWVSRRKDKVDGQSTVIANLIAANDRLGKVEAQVNTLISHSARQEFIIGQLRGYQMKLLGVLSPAQRAAVGDPPTPDEYDRLFHTSPTPAPPAPPAPVT